MFPLCYISLFSLACGYPKVSPRRLKFSRPSVFMKVKGFFFFFLESWSKKIERERKGSALFEMETGRGDNSRKQNLIKANTAIATSEMTDTEFFGSVDKYYFFLFEDFIEDPARFHLVFFAASFSSALGIFSQC